MYLFIDGIRMKVLRDRIIPEGYQSWTAVSYMDSDESRLRCAKWVRELIGKGILRKEEK